MTGVGGRPELIIEGTNDLNADDWKVHITSHTEEMCCLIVSLCLSVVIHLGCESLVGQAKWWRVRELVQECSTITHVFTHRYIISS